MRRATSSVQFISYNDEVIGICLGYDFCAEHEWGIKGLKRSLGLRNTKKTLAGLGPEKPILGIDSRRIHTLDPAHLLFRESLDGDAYLVYAAWAMQIYGHDENRLEESVKNSINRELSFSRWRADETVLAAWSDRDFGIRVRGNDNIEHLNKIYEALVSNNAIVTLAHTSYPEVFPEGGLYIFIGDKFPEHVDEAMKLDDQNKLDLQKAHDDLGLERELLDKGKRFFALSPKWLKDFGSKVETEYELIYWLNPMEQNRNNYGWYTVEELRLWAKDEGPVPKANNKKDS